MDQPTVAILGASADRRKFGNKAVRAFAQQGFRVFPINPKGGEIEGLPVYATLADVPLEHVDQVSVYLPPEIGRELLADIAAKTPQRIWLNPGSESDALLAEAERMGLPVVAACSIVALGVSPSDFPA